MHMESSEEDFLLNWEYQFPVSIHIRHEKLESKCPERPFKVLHSISWKKGWKSCTPEMKGAIYYNKHKACITCQHYME